MRLCFVSPEFVTEPSYSGGLANYLGRVTVALAERGHDVHVITRSDRDEQLDYRGVTVHRVVPLWDKRRLFDHADPLVPRVYYNLYQDFKAAWCSWRHWKAISARQKFDLVQVANVSSCGLFFRREKRLPVVTRLSSYRPIWDVAAGIPITKGVRARWKMERRAITGTRFIYAPSHYVANAIEKNYGVEKVEVIESPFFSEEPQTDESVYREIGAGADYALYFGRLTQMKGVQILAQALPEILRAQPDLQMIFAGPDARAPDGGGMMDFVRRHTQEFEERVHFTGSLRHDLLYPLVQNARLVVLPSLMDNLPNTCLEAMGLGRVVVATTGSCFDQLIEPGVSGFLVPPDDVSALAQGVIEAWDCDPTRRQAIGQKAQERIQQLHPDRALPRLIEYYECVLKQFGGKN